MTSRRTHRGFTLVEVLVALSILAIALAAAVRAASVATDAAGETRLRALATWVAQNRIAELQAAGVFPASGGASGSSRMGNADFDWKQVTVDTPNAAFRKVTISVSRPGETQTLVSLNAFLVRPPGSGS